MKKSLLASLFVMLVMSSGVFAAKADLFTEDFGAVDMSQLDQLETYVNANAGITYDQVAAQRADLVENVSATPSLNSVNRGRPPLGIPSFLWGCVFGVAGLAIVYFITEDRDETKKALWGCVTTTVVYIILYFAVFATAASQASAI